MAPKTLNIVISPLILALTLHLFISSSLAQEEGRKAARPVLLYITNTFPKSKNSPIITVHFSGQIYTAVQLSPGQQSHLTINQSGRKLNGLADYDRYFTAFDFYDHVRDKGHAAVYWKVDDWGFSISYDNKKWRKVSEWESD